MATNAGDIISRNPLATMSMVISGSFTTALLVNVLILVPASFPQLESKEVKTAFEKACVEDRSLEAYKTAPESEPVSVSMSREEMAACVQKKIESQRSHEEGIRDRVLTQGVPASMGVFTLAALGMAISERRFRQQQQPNGPS